MAKLHERMPFGRTASHSEQSPIETVQVEGLVLLKIIKHYQDESSSSQGGDVVQGALLGLISQDKVLEVTNCFALPRMPEGTEMSDEDFQETSLKYETDMISNLRQVNIDHMHVGWYQSGFAGAFINRTLFESQFNYQQSIFESVVLVYDPSKVQKGHISLKAYRLTQESLRLMIETLKEEDHPNDVSGTKSLHVNYDHLLVEVPVVIRNSHLVNAFLCELEENEGWASKRPGGRYGGFNLLGGLDMSATGINIERQLKLLMQGVDDMNQEVSKNANYQRQTGKLQQEYRLRLQQENAQRQARGEPPLSEDSPLARNRIWQPLLNQHQQRLGITLTQPPKLDSLMTSAQVDRFCQELNVMSGETVGKLLLTQSIRK